MDRTDLGAVRAHALSERRRTALAYSAAICLALAAGMGARYLMDSQHAPGWAALVVSELVGIVTVVGAFDALAERLDVRQWPDDDDPWFERQEVAVQAHQAGTCGCPSTRVMLADCDAWNDALQATADDQAAEDEIFPGSFHLVRAHMNRECGCEPGTELGYCPVWLDAVYASESAEGEAL